MTWYLAALPLLSALAALLEADCVHVGQWMVSRPMVAGPLFGAVLGSSWTGALLGCLLEAFGVQARPVGGVVPANGTVAAAVGVLLCLGPEGLSPAAAFPAALACGALFSRIEDGIRVRRAALALPVLAAAEEGRPIPWRGLFARSIGMHAAAAALFVYASSALLGPGLSWLWRAAPQTLRAGAGWAFEKSLWIGLAALLDALWRRG